MEYLYKITVFTPTFNRAHLLPRLYESLLVQQTNDFEWVIVDDGSEDNTGELVKSWIQEKRLEIRFFTQTNGGKHRAINKAVLNAGGELFFIVDSDDMLPNNSLNIIIEYYENYKNKGIVGVIGRKAYFDNLLVGSLVNTEKIITNSMDIRYEYGIKGDLAEVFKTELLKKYLFPTFEGEKFCPEVLVWNRIAQNYNILFFQEVIYQCEYLDGGLSDKIIEIRMHSPQASMLHYSELESYKIALIERCKANINFWRFSFNSSIRLKNKVLMVNYLRSVIGFPLGYIFHLRDKLKVE